MTIYLVKFLFTLYILVMKEAKKLLNTNISKHLSQVLDQLESVVIFDKNICQKAKLRRKDEKGAKHSISKNSKH